MPGETLVLFASFDGHTRVVAERIAGFLAEEGGKARAMLCTDAAAEEALRSAGGVLIGTPIHAGRPHKTAVRFVAEHHREFQGVPSALFLVCLTARERSEKAEAEIAKYHEDFARRTGWAPSLRAAFAGALPFSQYGFLKRQFMKAIARSTDKALDTSKDHVFTDWEAVRAFAKRFAEAAKGPR
ncbi:MAG: protoporphyrinogen oxidase [Planctomycetes bacterium]|jgi:menaquinone-dependent protoporphyrinogen oxidase|nr:protoporphyrinogen oxidase [Planctomycetota bacterium]